MSDLDAYQPHPDVRIEHPEWSRNATIYQINTRQFTPEGTFRAAEQHLPRLKALGATIVWLMPVQQIGEKNRKGTMGSPYAVKDYYSVEPGLGSLEDLLHFVTAAHAAGMYGSWTGSRTTPRGTATWSASIRSGTTATGRATIARRHGGTGTTSSIWTTPSPSSAGT